MPFELFVNFEAEQAVLGSILTENRCVAEAASLLTPAHFGTLAHRWTFAAMLEMAEANQAIDEFTLGGQLKGMGKLEEVGGYAYLAELALMRFAPANLWDYAGILVEQYTASKLLKALEEGAERLKSGKAKAGELIELVITKAQGLRDGLGTKSKVITLADCMVPIFSEVGAVSEGKKNFALPTGLGPIDQKLGGGMHHGDLIILAARPSMGKTSLAMSIAESVAVSHSQKQVLIFSKETGWKSLVRDRIIPIHSGISSTKLRNPGQMVAEDWERLAMATDRLSGVKNLKIYDHGGMRVGDVHRVISQEAERDGLDLVIIDYLQLFDEAKGGETRALEIGKITRRIKECCLSFHIPILLLSQLNREVDKTSRKPRLSDLRDSGAIEQDADVVIFIHQEQEESQLRDLIFEKNRNGETGTAQLVFLAERTQFRSPTRDDYQTTYPGKSR